MFSLLRPRRVVPDARALRLRRIFDENHDLVWRILRRAGVPPDRVEDAVQQVFLVTAERLDDVALGSERSFVYGVALRLARAAHRRGAREVLDDTSDSRIGGRPDPEALVARKRLVEACDQIIADLEPDVREVFVLHEIEGLSAPEIAVLVSIPLGTVASRLRRARQQFRAGVERIAHTEAETKASHG